VVLHSPVPAALLRANGECSGGEGAVVGGLTWQCLCLCILSAILLGILYLFFGKDVHLPIWHGSGEDQD
jgi:hypothetical protein